MTLDVIIPQHNQTHLTVRCIESILAGDTDVRLIVVDNASDPGERATVETMLRPGDVMITNDQNSPFAVAINQGLDASTSEYVCLQNNDTVVPPDGYRRMLSWFYGGVAAVGPLTNGCETEQRADGPGEGATSVRMLSFFCCILNRQIVDQIGPLSTEFGMGYGEDDDYCIRLRRAGYHLLIARDVFVHHDHHATARYVLGDDGMDREGAQGIAKLLELHGTVRA